MFIPNPRIHRLKENFIKTGIQTTKKALNRMIERWVVVDTTGAYD